MQTIFGANLEFSMRTFLFKTLGSSADDQQQTLCCNLHLDSVGNVPSTQAADCSCYSEADCSGNLFLIFKRSFANCDLQKNQIIK